ncbi:zinc finger protein CONSTANS-LIKE 2-like [Prosopis cineraria]|uniref:zinc finger protein CONSTANS-LIKE 2-like n=1 Tax=Prosopis cineraria TaxID=364024 RepID=UPI0024101416|nr:zinc finger protein CONSTANS-LIKE 2-like [Prosopis cineraria]
MKKCELCRTPARIYCESDQASLCWDCDAKVHGANFLVARHSRILLCHACQSPTPWKASGSVLGNTVSVCRNCDSGMNLSGEDGEESEGGNDTEINTEDDDDDAMFDGNDDADGDEVGGDEDADQQIVRWSSTTSPPPASSSSSDESSNDNRNVCESRRTVSLKRRSENASDHNFQDPTDGG